ncbi:uncharacterized protein EDB93DRAFT_1248464 [Suillus bovinus]|uniref:uncharacterized protein n=1 Tax=Suillus bovinus TaxID=48563 RepID=UPI001B87A582|nr:uncharacterized protein EDB93DRAFT_1248464 [Suillus bovinus]KAG2154269.1 hypothetical protein EDB93DRAFT_1248464 [Suillus bovinus]
MTSASYETSTFTNPSSAHDIRRSVGGSFSSAYDSPYSTARRRSPSPGPSSRRYAPYDSYIPRGGPSYRSDDHPNVYRPNAWRPERYNSRSPSPDRYERSRSMEPRFWDSGARWQPPWQDRRSSPSPPALREKLRRDTMAERMFEPSDSWKQSHVDRSGRYEVLEPPSPRFPDYRARPARDYSPLKSPAYPPIHGDTYRPYSSGQSYREPHVFVRSDSYRPQYDDSARRSPRSVDNSNTDVCYPRRPSSHYDHDDTLSSTSIASTPPPHAVNSPPPDPHITNSDARRHSPSCRRASPAHSVARSRASSISSDAPHKRSQLRSSSRSSASSRPDKSAIFAHNGSKDIVSTKQNRESTIRQAPTHVLSRDPDRLGSTSNTLTGKGSTHPEPLPHELLHVGAKPVHPVMNGELNGPPLASNFLRSSPSLLPGEGATIPFACQYPEDIPILDVEMSPPGLISSHALPSDVELAFLGDSAGKGTEMQTNQISPLSNNIKPATPQPALKSVGAVANNSPASATATATPSPESRMLEKDVDVGSPRTLTGDTPLLKSAPQVIATESVGSPSRIEAEEQLLTPALDVEQPATWFYGRPSFSDPTAKALRFVVLTRLQCDRQTRDERVVPVLRANRAIREPSLPSPIDAQDNLFQEFAADQPRQERMTLHSQSMRSSLSGHFLERETALRQKQQKLREEYLELHQQWIAQCARLDNVSKGGLPEESLPTSAGGRSTRRSAAVLGDAVRSDLEMEQIIANLGMEELTDPSYLAIKNVAKIPDMVSVVDSRGPYSYDDTNNLLDDPAEFYSSSSALDLWTEEERIVFKERYAAHPKQFGLIAQHLPNKTAAQCVTYYYLHKPHVDFRKAIAQYGAGRRRRNGRGANKQKGNALLADIRRHDDEVLAAHPTSSAVPSKRRRAAILRSNVEPRRNQSRRGTVQPDQTPTSSGTTPDPEADEQKRRRRSTAVARSSGLAQEEVEPTEPGAEAPPPKQTRRPRKPRARAVATPSEEATPAPELPDYCKPSMPISWSKEDKSLFLELLSQHGDNVHHVAASMPHKVHGDLVAGCGAP